MSSYISKIKNCPELNDLKCVRCNFVDISETHSKISKLLVDECMMTKISNLKNLVKLTCIRCNDLTSIVNCQNLLRLNCEKCDKLSTILDCDNLLEIKCKKLTKNITSVKTNGDIILTRCNSEQFTYDDNYIPKVECFQSDIHDDIDFEPQYVNIYDVFCNNDSDNDSDSDDSDYSDSDDSDSDDSDSDDSDSYWWE